MPTGEIGATKVVVAITLSARDLVEKGLCGLPERDPKQIAESGPAASDSETRLSF